MQALHQPQNKANLGGLVTTWILLVTSCWPNKSNTVSGLLFYSDSYFIADQTDLSTLIKRFWNPWVPRILLHHNMLPYIAYHTKQRAPFKGFRKPWEDCWCSTSVPDPLSNCQASTLSGPCPARHPRGSPWAQSSGLRFRLAEKAEAWALALGAPGSCGSRSRECCEEEPADDGSCGLVMLRYDMI